MKLEGSLVLDASSLVEIVFSTRHGSKLMELIIEQKIKPHATEIAITELEYILCRKIGKKKSKERVDKLLASGYINIEKTAPLREDAAQYKCKRAISLPDCFSLALGRRLSSPVLFAVKEEELLKEMKKQAFDVKILFLEDFK